MASLLSPLNETPSLDKLAYEKIKQAILTFQFLPNQSLVEGDLAAQLAISKTPVRDALMRLEKEGLVTRVPYKGTYVSELTPQEMINIFQIRIALEGLAASLATPLLTAEDFRKMQSLIDAHSECLQAKDVSGASKINSDFHNIIVQKCSNTRLQVMLLNLDDQLKRYRLLSVAQGLRMDKSIPEHSMILEAFQKRDTKAAEEAMKIHLTSAMNDLSNQNFEELVQQLHNNSALIP